MELPVPPLQLKFMTSLKEPAPTPEIDSEVAVAAENCPLLVSRVMVNWKAFPLRAVLPMVPVRLPERANTKVTADAVFAANRLHARKAAAKALCRVFN